MYVQLEVLGMIPFSLAIGDLHCSKNWNKEEIIIMYLKMKIEGDVCTNRKFTN